MLLNFKDNHGMIWGYLFCWKNPRTGEKAQRSGVHALHTGYLGSTPTSYGPPALLEGSTGTTGLHYSLLQKQNKKHQEAKSWKPNITDKGVLLQNG